MLSGVPNGDRIKFPSGPLALPMGLVRTRSPPLMLITDAELVPIAILLACTIPLATLTTPVLLPLAANARFRLPRTTSFAATPITVFEPTLLVPTPNFVVGDGCQPRF